MKQTEYDYILYLTAIGITLAEQLDVDELLILAAALEQLGETLELIALQRERGSFKVP